LEHYSKFYPLHFLFLLVIMFRERPEALWMYQWLVEGFCLTSGSTALTLAWIRARRYKTFDAGAVGSEGFSPTRYEPMKRLLSEEDFAFLKRRPGVGPTLIRRMRVQRRKVFRSYLCELAADFNRLHEEARMMVAVAPEEYSDLVGILMRTQVRFWSALAGVEVRLALHTIGIGQMDIRSLLAPLEALHSAVHRTTPGLEPI
jgi:hypothetical protein